MLNVGTFYLLNLYVGRTLKFVFAASREINIVSEATVRDGNEATVVV